MAIFQDQPISLQAIQGVNPEAFVQRAEREQQANAQQFQAIQQGIYQGIQNFENKRQEKQQKTASIEMLKQLGIVEGLSDKAIEAGINEVGAANFLKTLQGLEASNANMERARVASEIAQRDIRLREQEFFSEGTQPQDRVVTKEQLKKLSENFSVTTQPRQDGTFQITSMTSRKTETPTEKKGKVISQEEFDERTEAGQRPKVEFDAEGNMRLLSVEPVAEQGETLTPFQTKTSEDLAEPMNKWRTSGKQQAEGNLEQYNKQIAGLKSGEITTRGLLDYAPSFFGIQDATRALFRPLDQQAVDRMNQIVFQGLRGTLGAQFTQREAERLVAASYNPKLPEEQNIERIQASADILERTIRAKNDLMAHMDAGGNIGNYKGLMAESVFESGLRDMEMSNAKVPILTPSGANVRIKKIRK